MSQITTKKEDSLPPSEIHLDRPQNQALNYVFNSITHNTTNLKDILVVIAYHWSNLEETKNINAKSKPYYETRLWVVNNLVRILDEKYLDPVADDEVQKLLALVPWVITCLVKCHKILIADDEKYIRHFAFNLRRILKLDMHLQNLLKDHGTESHDLAEVINTLKQEEMNSELC